MVKTNSTMLPLGTKAPHFMLPNIDGQVVRVEDFKGKAGLLVMFICNHCPFVKHLRSALAEFGRECQAHNVAVVAISSNDVENYPDDSPELMKAEAAAAGYSFPYLYDADQSVAVAYKAACTPDFFLFNSDMALVYRGQFDSSRPGNQIAITGQDLRAAVEAMVHKRPIIEDQKPSMGCNIKWLPGKAPEYFTGKSAV